MNTEQHPFSPEELKALQLKLMPNTVLKRVKPGTGKNHRTDPAKKKARKTAKASRRKNR